MAELSPARDVERVAVIDCGSNTFSLLVAEVCTNEAGQKSWKKLMNQSRYVHLGRGSFRSGRLDPDRMRRAWDVLGMYVESLRNAGVSRYACLATSAARDAKNSDDFIAGARAVGCNVQVIDGLTEARLVQRGVRSSVEAADTRWASRTLASLDIGGGSVEMSLWTGNSIHYTGSLDIGLSRLRDWVKPQLQWSPKDLESVARIIDEAMHPFLKAAAEYPPEAWVGSSGTIEALQRLLEPEIVPGYEVADLLPPLELAVMLEKLIPMHQNALIKLEHLHPDRVPYISLGSALVRQVLQASGVDQLYCSRYAMAEGLLTMYAGGESTDDYLPAPWQVF
jgi:exopolyphosphatase/guanosine-5'-triphosphate,3'-diphosphate pyrophosphatase